MKKFFLGLIVTVPFLLVQAQENDDEPAGSKAEQQQPKQAPTDAAKADTFKPSERLSEDHPAVFPADI